MARTIVDVLDSVRNSIIKEYGEGTAVRPSDVEQAKFLGGRVELWTPTGIKGLDAVLGRENHGLPGGKIIEIYGQEGHGKSSLVYYLIGLVQKAGGYTFLNDTELSYDFEWAEKLGVDNSLLTVFPLVPKKSCLEGYFDIIENTIAQIRAKDESNPILFVHDTLYATPTLEELSNTSYTDKQRINSLPRAVSSHIKALNASVSFGKATLIFVNQVRDNIGVMYGDKYTTPGGRALRHMSSVRVFVKRKRKKSSGIDSQAVNTKNKLQAPFATAEFTISAAKGLTVSKTGKLKPSD